jgi:hypothetical protein
VIILCDQCERTIEIEKDADVPWPWQVVVLLEEGEYHACCEGCGSLLLKSRGEPLDSS